MLLARELPRDLNVLIFDYSILLARELPGDLIIQRHWRFERANI
uniref:Uncharacterized protein n=1 Tax=viral metagenome TaxID=1070528 RepID=A0A6C0CA63_9ZZZZ